MATKAVNEDKTRTEMSISDAHVMSKNRTERIAYSAFGLSPPG